MHRNCSVFLFISNTDNDRFFGIIVFMLKKFGRKVLAKQKDKRFVIGEIILIILLIAFVVWLVWPDKKPAPVPNLQNPAVQEYQRRLPELKDKAEKEPTNADARTEYAIALYATEDKENAAKQYEEAIKLRPDDATLHNNLGNTYRDLRKYEEAAKQYEESIRIAPKQQNAYINLANVQIYSLKKTNDGLATYRKGIAAMPENQDIPLLLAVAQEQAGDKAGAKKTLQELIAKHPDNNAAKSNLDRLNKS